MNEVAFFKPCESLAPYISGFLLSHVKFNGIEKPFFTPKGAAAIVIPIHISPTSYLEYPTKSNQIFFENSTPYLFGQMSKIGYSFFEGRFEFFVIVFTPTGLFHFLEGSASEATDRVMLLEHYGKQELHYQLKNIFEDSRDQTNLINIVEQVLLAHFNCLEPKKMTIDIAHAAHQILIKKGLVALDELIDEYGVNKRTFQIHFKNQVGISAKLFCRIIRFNLLLLILDKDPTVDILEFALRFGYTDTSHLHKDFVAFVGMSPKKYVKMLINYNAEIEKLIKSQFLK
ncbi:MAG: helix-turn-helix domain-containing protein [Mongoliitalea sp.]